MVFLWLTFPFGNVSHKPIPSPENVGFSNPDLPAAIQQVWLPGADEHPQRLIADLSAPWASEKTTSHDGEEMVMKKQDGATPVMFVGL